MATTPQAKEFMRNFRTVHLEPCCDRLDCHGTHVERITWEIALRRSNELATEEVMAELDDDDRNFMIWVAYVTFARDRYGSSVSRPPFKRKPNVIVPPKLRETGFDPAEICWACDDPECPICTLSKGSNRLQQVVLRERRVVSIGEYLNREELMAEFFALLAERTREAQ